MSKLQAYTNYQPVKYDYVSQLPEGWQLLPNIAIFQERIERGHDNEELLSVTIGKGVIRQTDVDIKTLDYIFELIDQNPELNAWELWKIAKKESKKYDISKKAYANYLQPHKVEEARIDNSNTFKEIDLPTLVIIGEKDILVDPKQSKTELEKIENPSIKFKEIKGLNHFMTKNGTDWVTIVMCLGIFVSVCNLTICDIDNWFK